MAGTLQEQERCCAVWQTALLEQEATLLSSIDPAHLALDPSSPSLAASPSIAQSLQSFRDAKSVSDKRLAVDAALSRVKEALSGVDSDATVGPPLKRQRKEPTPSLPHSVNETICRLFECTLEQYQLECNTAKFKVQNFTQLVKDVRQVLQLSADHRILDGERLTKATSLLDEAERKQASASSETEVEDVLVRPSRPEEEAAALEMIRGGILDLFPHSREKAETYLSKQDDLTDPRGLGAFYARGGGCFLVAEADGRLAGCVGMQPRLLMEEKWLPGKASNEKELEAMRKEMRSQMEVRRLSVSQDFRRRGIGRKLMAALESRTRQLGTFTNIHLTTTAKMPAAQALYRSLGYSEVLREKGGFTIHFDKSLKASGLDAIK